MVTLSGGVVLCSKAVTQRVSLAVTDAIGITVHKTNKTDLDKIEKELIEPDELALYDSSNNIKVKALEGK